jgi:hypothetical protein
MYGFVTFCVMLAGEHCQSQVTGHCEPDTGAGGENIVA